VQFTVAPWHEKRVEHFLRLERPPSAGIDDAQGRRIWNNDWIAALEPAWPPPPSHKPFAGPFWPAGDVFSRFYFGWRPQGDPRRLERLRFANRTLLVEGPSSQWAQRCRIAWGFVSGASPASARYVLLAGAALDPGGDPPLGWPWAIAPDKPDPPGLLRLATSLFEAARGAWSPPVGLSR